MLFELFKFHTACAKFLAEVPLNLKQVRRRSGIRASVGHVPTLRGGGEAGAAIRSGSDDPIRARSPRSGRERALIVQRTCRGALGCIEADCSKQMN